MITLYLCEKPLDGSDNDGNVHNVCDAIWQDRNLRDTCVTCGENPVMPDIQVYRAVSNICGASGMMSMDDFSLSLSLSFLSHLYAIQNISNMVSITEKEFDKYLDETYGEVRLCGIVWDSSALLKISDPGGYKVAKTQHEL